MAKWRVWGQELIQLDVTILTIQPSSWKHASTGRSSKLGTVIQVAVSARQRPHQSTARSGRVALKPTDKLPSD